MGLFVMCEVALGKQYEVTHPTHSVCPKEFDSTKCNGEQYPDPAGDKLIDKAGYVVPMGNVINNPNGGYMGVNEYIVYDTSQIMFHYLIKFQM